MMPRASFRLFRTGLIGSSLLGLAAGGHLAGGGQLPALSVLAALCAVTIVPVAALSRFRLSFPVLTGLIGAGQVWLHWAFGALSAGAPSAIPPALLLARGEQALGVLAGWLEPLLRQPEPAPILPARVPGPCAAAAVLPPMRPGLRLPSRRGPPMPASAA